MFDRFVFSYIFLIDSQRSTIFPDIKTYKSALKNTRENPFKLITTGWYSINLFHTAGHWKTKS